MANLFVALGLFAFSYSDSQPAKTEIPSEFHGVWTVISALDDGTEMPMPANPGVSLSAGECNFSEIIVCKSRVIIVQNDGSAIVAKTRVLTSMPQTKIEMVAPRAHDKQQEPSFAILGSINTKKIQFAFCPKESKIVNNKKGGKQVVITATR